MGEITTNANRIATAVGAIASEAEFIVAMAVITIVCRTIL